MNTTFNHLPCELQELIYNKKHQLEMKDVFDELMIKKRFYEHYYNIKNACEELDFFAPNKTCRVYESCKFSVRSVCENADYTLMREFLENEGIDDGLYSLLFDINELELKLDIKIDSIDFDDIVDTMMNTIIVYRFEDMESEDDEKDSDEEESDDEDSDEDSDGE